MKKMLLLSVMALAGLTASAQFGSKPSVVPQTNSIVLNKAQTQRSFRAVAPRQDLGMRLYAPVGERLTLDPAKVKPVTLAERTSSSVLPAALSNTKAFGKGMAKNRNMRNLQPMLNLNTKTSTRAKAARKAPAFAETYTGKATNYFTKENVEWTTTPSVATNSETNEEVNVLVNVIPAPDFLSGLYPDGIPVKYTVGDDDVITIAPQAVASYQNEAKDTTFYVTLFSANSDDEDGVVNMTVNESGKLTVTNGNWICFGEFANVEFDVDMSDSEAYLGMDELFVNVAYYYHVESTIDKEYNAHGTDYFANEAVDWVMQRGTTKMDDEETHFFVNMTPMIDLFSEIYPDGVDVAYEQNGNVITVKPQVIASTTDNAGNPEYIMICSGTSEDGNILLTEGEDGALTISDTESIIIGAWSTNKFDSSFDTYLGSYSYIENIKYRLPGAPAEAPKDVAFEPEETVLFAGMGYSGRSYNDNLAMIAAYAPTNFRNATMDIATSFEWSAKEVDDDVETPITGQNRHFTLNTKGGAVYEDFSLIAYNEDAASAPYTWGVGHALNSEKTAPRYEAIHVYAGESANDFQFSDGTYAVMTRQNPDYDLTFYINWATNDILEQYNSSTRVSTIYSYQGKPATPLYLTGVSLPMVSFTANEDFNLHIKICKCTRNARGTLTVGDVIAEGDASTENVVDQYDAGIKAVEFTQLYTEDEFGMSENVDHLFIEDEFVIIIEGWDNGTFSGVLGSQEHNFNEITSTWFQAPGETRLRSYGGGWPQLFIGLIDATYGYLHTEDDTNLIYAKEGGTSTIHVDPMLYSNDEETGEPSYLLNVESVSVDGEEVDEIPEWITIEVANEDYTKAKGVDDEGNEYEYFVNGIDYDLVITLAALPEGVENRTAKIVFWQTGAKLTVTITQNIEGAGVTGDLNGDKKVDIADAVTVLNIMAAGEYNAAADINGDQKVDIADFVSVLNIMAAQ